MNIPELRIGELVATTPIVQGGMGVGVSMASLASAVANEGGIGVIAAAMIGLSEKDVVQNPIEANNKALRKEIRKAREKTKGIIGINIMVALTTFAESVRTAIEEKADIIFSGAGLPLDLPRHLRELCDEKKEEFKTKLVPIVSSARAAAIITKKWQSRFGYTPDAFVLEGPQAGGHLGYRADQLEESEFALEVTLPPLVELVKQLEASTDKKIPIIVGGGVFTGQDIAHFLKMGASGVQMGTRFVATEECDADIRFKEAYINAKAEDVTIIQSPVGMPGRALDGSFLSDMREGKKKPVKCMFHCIHTCDPQKTPYCIASSLINAMRGNLDKGFVFCGTNVGRVDKIVTVHELMETLRQEILIA